MVAQPYDFIVERDGVFKKIQVKHSFTYRVRLRKSDNKARDGKQFYKEGDFDYLCACKFPHVYVVPWGKLKGKTQISFSAYPEYCYDLNDPQIYKYRPTI